MKLSSIIRVWKVTKKPTMKEYLSVAKIVFVGFLIIGIIGFIMELFYQFVLKYLF